MPMQLQASNIYGTEQNRFKRKLSASKSVRGHDIVDGKQVQYYIQEALKEIL
jgi:hypothetical protein